MTKALQARKTGRLELWGDGQQRRGYLYIDDAVDRIVRVMEADDYHGPVNIASQQIRTCRDVAELALAIVGADAEIVTNDTEPSGVLSRECSVLKFFCHYGHVKETSLSDGLSRFAAWLELSTLKSGGDL